LGLAAGAFLALVRPLGSVTFSTETVATDASSPSMAIGSDGDIHLAYFSSNNLIYGRRTGTSWALEMANNENPLNISLALDGAGRPHAVYNYVTATRSLRHAVKSGGTWSATTVESGKDYTAVSAAVDGAGRVHVAYYQSVDKILKYALYNGVSWSTQTVDSSGDVGSYASLAIDSAGDPYIAYQDATVSRLRLAERHSGGAWSISNVDAGGTPYYISLALDNQGHGRISYQRASALRYASYDGATWSISTVSSNLVYNNELALDGQGRGHIAYAFWNTGTSHYDLVYASYTGTAWSTTTVQADLSSLPTPTLSLDSSGLPHVSYQDTLNSKLMAAHASGTGAAAPMSGNSRGLVQQPLAMAGTAVGVSSITWSWTDNSSNELGFRLYGSTSSAASFTLLASTTSLVANAVSFTQTSLSANTSYQAYVVAVGSGGVVLSSSVVRYTSAWVPSGLVVTSATQDTSALNWSPNGNPEPGTSYEIQTATESGFTTPASVIVSTSGGTLTDLLPSTTYYFRVRARNGDLQYSVFAASTSTTTALSADVTPPNAVSSLSAAWVGSASQIRLSWISPGDDGATAALPAGSEYKIQYSTITPASVTWSTANAQVTISTHGINPGTTQNVDVTMPLALQTYYFRVWVHDEKPNYSAPSSTVSALSVPFSQETLDGTSGDPGSLAVDRQGNLHACYADTGGLSYIRRTGTTWSAPTLIDTVNSGGRLALDGAGQPHIAYFDSVSSQIKYASNNGVTWSTSALNDTQAKSALSLAVDAGAGAHIAYQYFANAGDSGLRYAYFNGVSWTTTTVLSESGNNGYGAYNSIALDGAGRPRIAFNDAMYAVFDGTSWNVEGSVPSYENVSLALDGQDRPHVSSFEDVYLGLGYLWYGTKSAGSWDSSRLDPPGGGTSDGMGERNAIALDGQGHPHIAYLNYITYQMKYAYFDGTVWTSGIISSSTEHLLDDVSLAIDGAGDAHILYYDYTANDLRAEHWTGAGFSPAFGGNNGSRSQEPYGLAATLLSSTSFRLDWTDNATGEWGYRVYGSTTPMAPYTLMAGTDTLAANAVTFTESNLTPGTTYYRYVAAVGAGGVVTSNRITLLLSSAATPSGWSGSALGVSSISWSWNDVTDELGYRVTTSTGGFLSGDLVPDTVAWPETGLSTNTAYTRLLSAFNTIGVSTTAPLTRYTGADLPAPAGASFASVATGSIIAAWLPHTNPVDVTTYTVVASTDPAGPHNSGGDVTFSTRPAGTSPTAQLDDLVANTTYQIFVRAENGDGLPTAYLALGSTVTRAETPTALDPTSVGSNRVTARWGAGGNASDTIYQTQISTDGFSTVLDSTLTVVSSATFFGLGAAKSYDFQVRAIARDGTPTGYTVLPSTRTLAVAPGVGSPAYTGVGTSSLTIHWTDANLGSVRFQAQLSTDSGFGAVASSSDTAALSTLFGAGGEGADLSPNTTYYLRVQAYVGTDFSSYTVPGATATWAAAPQSLTVLSASSAAVTLDWSAAGNPENTTRYELWRDTHSNFSAPVLTTVSTSAADVTSLNFETTYYFRVRAYGNNSQYTSFSNDVSGWTALPWPGTPGGFSGAALSPTSIRWSWNDVDFETGWRVASDTQGIFSPDLPADTTTWVETNLSTNTVYTRSVAAFNLTGVSSSTTLSRYTTAAPPKNLALTAVNVSSLTLAWQVNGNPPDTLFRLIYSAVGHSSTTADVASDSITLTQLTARTTYYFSLEALNGNGFLSGGALSLSTFTYKVPDSTGTIAPQGGGEVILEADFGQVRLTIPPQTFGEAVAVTLSQPLSFPGAVAEQAGLIASGMGVEITTDKALQPSRETTLTLEYNPARAAEHGIDEGRLTLARYDSAAGRWVPLPTENDRALHRLSGRTSHFSIFQAVQFEPSVSPAAVRAFPNPLRPSHGQSWMTFEKAPAGARLRVYTIAGEAVRELSADSSGIAQWDGKNTAGIPVASGVYVVLVEGENDRELIKVAVQR
jgi:hypothetical protein